MRVATLRDHSLDGRLVIVAPDGKTCRPAQAETLQAALDHGGLEPAGDLVAYHENLCHAPLPRAYQFLDGSAYVNHVELVRKARGVPMPDSFWTDPLMYQGGSDGFLGPRDDIVGDPDWGIDFEAEIAVIIGAVPMGASAEEAAKAIRFVMLCNDVSLRNLIPAELAKGFGFVQSKPACAFSPLAVTPEALPGWQAGKLHGVLNVDLNGEPFGRADAGVDMTFDFPTLIAHAAKARSLAAGTIIGSGTVSNKGENGPGLPIPEGGTGYSCIAEQRTVETLLHGQARTQFLRPGDRVKIWMEDASGASLFGAIEQSVRAL